jgi:hypothetical protein
MTSTRAGGSAAFVPLHGERLPLGLSGWPRYREVVWYDGPLVFLVGDADERYLAIASSIDGREGATAYFLVAVTPDGLISYARGGSNYGRLVELAGGSVHYSFDNLATFETVRMGDMCPDDRVALGRTGRDYGDLFETLVPDGDPGV